MRCVVLHAHPLEDSLSAALRDRVVDQLTAGGHEVNLACLTQGEHIDASAVEGAEALLLVYPTWWGGLPAPLLGWVQTELGPWIDGGSDLADSPLAAVRHLVAVTTHGSTKWVNRLQGEPGRQLLRRTVTRLCAPRTRLRWVSLYGIDRVDATKIDAFVERVGATAASLS